ncbi:MAG TPA: adenosyl-hopene transferase HpnH [Rhodospirillales bacterium]|jgi:hopanoid biosynthesis associated radical SAM protein HpnH|nr:hopanoid biosynthesis associated radical SAM protein HpnH [Rhodospirillaceae bacterium]HJN23633.1 adenosyl-hopene transferase HpnH [Rhodospirillales bacterium]
MTIPLIQRVRVGAYVVKQRLKGVRQYPLVLMLEPLFRCNLSCSGCGKIDFPETILNRRLSVAECLAAADECGAPIVSIPGGEPLLHKDIGDIVTGLTRRRKFVYLCTNGLLLKKKLDLFTPSPYLTLSIHLDGNRDHHDRTVDQPGVYDLAVAAIREARGRGFRVTVNCTLFDTADAADMADFFTFTCNDLDVESITVAPGYAYESAPAREHFLTRSRTKEFFRDLFRRGKGRNWRFNQSALYLDFLAGNQQYQCTPWGSPTRNIFGWQRPCYLLSGGYAKTFKELMEDTEWNNYGTGNYEKCADCMVHCGYEPTAVVDTVAHPWKALKVTWRGPETVKSMAPELSFEKQRPATVAFAESSEKLTETESGTGKQSDAA